MCVPDCLSPKSFCVQAVMDVEEFHAVFKRYPDPWNLRRLWGFEQGK
jgi:hypothetical protein